MIIRKFASIFTTAALVIWALNIAWLAVLAAPISWLWNHAAMPLGGLPQIGYLRALGLLILWFLLCNCHLGVKISAKQAQRSHDDPTDCRP